MATIYQYDLAVRLEQAGEFGRAFRLFERLMFSEDHDHGDILFHCGWCLENDLRGDNRQALFCYQEAAECAADPVCRMNSAFRSGWLLMHEKRYDEAIAAYQKAVGIHESTPLHPEIYADALYWQAVCLETSGRYLDAIKIHRKVQNQSTRLMPESRFREIICRNQVGDFQGARSACHSFRAEVPEEFDRERYLHLQKLALQELQVIDACLAAAY